MKRNELRACLRLYPKIREAIERGDREIELIQNERKKKLELRPWVQKLPDIIMEILAGEENEVIRVMIEQSILKGRKSYEIVRALPLSERTYYRWKAKFEEKVYELLILTGEVSREEILEEGIDS